MEFKKIGMVIGFLISALFFGCGGSGNEGGDSGSLLGQQALPTPGVPPEDLTGSYTLTYSYGQSTCSQDLISAIQDFFPVEVLLNTIQQNGAEITVVAPEEDFFASVDNNDQHDSSGIVSGNGAEFELEGSDTLDNGCTISGYERVVFFVDTDNTVTGTDVAQVTLSGSCSPFQNQTCEIQLDINGNRTMEIATSGSTASGLTQMGQESEKRSLWSTIF